MWNIYLNTKSSVKTLLVELWVLQNILEVATEISIFMTA
jgi:hypothetical protein